jgi:hypothetical protein
MPAKVLRLISGEELMGEVEEKEDNKIFIKNVCQIVTSYADTTSATARVGLAPFMPYTKSSDGITVEKSYIGFITDPVNELINEYNKVFGSGLVMPPSKPTLQTSAPSGNHGFVKI